MLAEANEIVVEALPNAERDTVRVVLEGAEVELYPHQFAALFTPLPSDDETE